MSNFYRLLNTRLTRSQPPTVIRSLSQITRPSTRPSAGWSTATICSIAPLHPHLFSCHATVCFCCCVCGVLCGQSLSSGASVLPLAVVSELPAWMVGQRQHYQGFGRGAGSSPGGGGGRSGRGGKGREGGRDQRGAGYARGDRQRTGRQEYSRPAYDSGRNGGRSGGSGSRSRADPFDRAGSRFGSSGRSIYSRTQST